MILHKGNKIVEWRLLYSYLDVSTLPFTENKSACLLSTKFFSGEPNTPTDIHRRERCPYKQQAGTWEIIQNDTIVWQIQTEYWGIFLCSLRYFIFAFIRKCILFLTVNFAMCSFLQVPWYFSQSQILGYMNLS